MRHYFCLASTSRQEQEKRQGVMKKSAAYALGIDSKYAVSALVLHARNVAISTNSVEKIYHGLRAVGNPLTTFERYLFYRRLWNFSSGLASTMSRQAVGTKKSRASYISLLISMLSETADLWSYGVEFSSIVRPAGYNSRYLSRIRKKVIKSYVWNIIFWVSTTTTLP